MSFMDNIKELQRMGAHASAMKDRTIKKSFAASAQDSIFQFPCLISNTIPVDMATATMQYLDRRYAEFVRIVVSQIGNVNMFDTPTPVQFLKSLHQNIRVESATDEEERLIKEDFFDGNCCVMFNPVTKVAMTFESAGNNHAPVLRQLNYESTREWLSDYDLVPMVEANITTSELLQRAIDNTANRHQREIQDLNVKINKEKKAPMLLDKDVKKFNDALPYAIQIRLNVVNDSDQFVQYWDIVVGIKTIMHLLKSDEICDNIANTIKTRDAVFNFIRWTTGEISFFKDLVLHLDDLKFDLMAKSRGYSSWFPTLKRLKDKKVTFRNFKPTNVIPNATLVISSYEVDEIERKYGFDVKDISIAKRIIDNLMLMSFIIMDDASNTMDILTEGKTSFETYALETIRREVLATKNTTSLGREIGRMFGSSM